MEPKILNHILYRKIIFLITDGFENDSRPTKEIIEETIQNSEITMIILGLTRKEETILYLKDLARYSKEGMFISYDEAHLSEYVFRSYNETKRGPVLFVESF